MPSPEIWKLRKQRILKLYSDGLQLKMVMKILSTEGFDATYVIVLFKVVGQVSNLFITRETQYRTKLKKWEYRKPRKCRKRSEAAKVQGQPSPIQSRGGADSMKRDLACLVTDRMIPESNKNDARFVTCSLEELSSSHTKQLLFGRGRSPRNGSAAAHQNADKSRFLPAVPNDNDNAMIPEPSPWPMWDTLPEASSFMVSSWFDNSSLSTNPSTPHTGATQEVVGEYSRRTRQNASHGNGYQPRVKNPICRLLTAEERKQSSDCEEVALSSATPPIRVDPLVTAHPPMTIDTAATHTQTVAPPMINHPMMFDTTTELHPSFLPLPYQISVPRSNDAFSAAFTAQHPQIPESWWR
ncbi:MAG: hypothetical protein M1830_004033 [Pleopsidium flavum]|nr:MAG: hypothetical protein M1830_004033 [Pleopsidium flavum]